MQEFIKSIDRIYSTMNISILIRYESSAWGHQYCMCRIGSDIDSYIDIHNSVAKWDSIYGCMILQII